MSLTGHVEDLGVAEILHVVGISQRSGELVLDANGLETRMLFHGGLIVGLRQPHAPKNLVEMLVHWGVTDQVHAAVLERQAQQEGQPLIALIEAEGRITQGEIESRLRTEVEKSIKNLLDLPEGEFAFHLLDDVGPRSESYGGLILKDGIEPARIPGVTEHVRPESSREHDVPATPQPGRRQAELLIEEEEISLPMAIVTSPAPVSPPSSAVAVPKKASGTAPRTVIVGLSAGRVRQELLHRLPSAGLDLLAAESLVQAEDGLAAARAAGDEVVVLTDSAHPEMPGLEVLARIRTLNRETPVIVAISDDATTSRRAAFVERAARLGADHVVLVPSEGRHSDGAETVADHLVELLLGLTDPRPRPPSTPAAALPEAPDGSSGLVPDFPSDRPRRDQVAVSNLARALAPGREIAEVALAILDVSAEHLERGLLLVDWEDAGIRSVGAFGRGVPDLLNLPLDPEGRDFLSDGLRQGASHLGSLRPTTSYDAALWERLGKPTSVLLLPLLAEGHGVGALYGEPNPNHPPDVQLLTTLMAKVAPILHRARHVARQRALAHAARTTP